MELLELTEQVGSLENTELDFMGQNILNSQAETYKEYLSASSNSMIAAWFPHL